MNSREPSSRAGEETRQLTRDPVDGARGAGGAGSACAAPMVSRHGKGDQPYREAAAQRFDGEAADEIGDDEGDRPPQTHAP